MSDILAQEISDVNKLIKLATAKLNIVQMKTRHVPQQLSSALLHLSNAQLVLGQAAEIELDKGDEYS